PRLGEREHDPEARSARRRGLAGDVASVVADDLLGDREPETEPRLLGGEEGQEDLRALVGRDPGPVVVDEHLDALPRREDAAASRESAPRRKLRGLHREGEGRLLRTRARDGTGAAPRTLS